MGRRRLRRREVAPVAREINNSGEFPRALFRRFGGQGHRALGHLEAYGGAAADFSTYCLFAEESALVATMARSSEYGEAGVMGRCQGREVGIVDRMVKGAGPKIFGLGCRPGSLAAPFCWGILPQSIASLLSGPNANEQEEWGSLWHRTCRFRLIG